MKETAPEAEIVRNAENRGFAGGNNDAMRLALAQGHDYIVLFNMDTIVAVDCISRLIEAAEGDGVVGAVQARLMLWPQTDKINSLGNMTHFLGFGYCGGYGEDWSGDSSCAIRDIAYPSGAAVLYKKDVLEKIGLFDEEFRIYNEDQDLGWRIWLSGGRCVLAPRAVVYHKYDFSRYPERYYWLDRNRLLAMMKNYGASTLLMIFPAFVVMEIGLLMFAWQKGWLREKLHVYRYFFSRRNRRYLREARRRSQALRRVKDWDIVGMFSGRIWYEEVGSEPLHIANKIMEIYWNAVKRVMAAGRGGIH